jgi:Ca2+ transporting ATPase
MLLSIKTMADKALRTIVCAYRDLPANTDISTKNELGVFDVETKDLILQAIFGIYDVVRPEVPEAIRKCKFLKNKKKNYFILALSNISFSLSLR